MHMPVTTSHLLQHPGPDPAWRSLHAIDLDLTERQIVWPAIVFYRDARCHFEMAVDNICPS